MNVLIDFDNTLYIKNRDVDDAMALFFLLAQENVNIVGMTSTYGNSTIDNVDACCHKLLQDLNLPIHWYAKGGANAGEYVSPASQKIAQLARDFSGDITILGLGSLTNLHGAYLCDPQFYENVSQIVLMGGKTAPLTLPKKEMIELNFSCDPMASFSVLTKGKNVSVITGNTCLDVLFTRQQYEEFFNDVTGPTIELIKEYSDPWFRDNLEEFGIAGFYNWDSLAAAYITHPQLFEDMPKDLTLSVYGLSTGDLLAKSDDLQAYSFSKPVQKKTINIPKVRDGQALIETLYQSWVSLGVK